MAASQTIRVFAASYDPTRGGVQPGVKVTFENGGWLETGLLLNPWPVSVKTADQVFVCDVGTSDEHQKLAHLITQCNGTSHRVTASLVPEPGHEGGMLIAWPINLGHTYTISPAT